MGNSIIINIGRQLGAGGHDIGRMLAEEFSARCYDRELLNLAAKESGFAPEFFEKSDERKGFLRSFLHLPHSGIATTNFYQDNISQESLFQFQSDAIRKAAHEGSCVFIGRCADYVLRDHPGVVNVFITASLEFRVQKVTERQHISREEALKLIELGESRRAAYYNYYTGKKWGQASNYHLCLDSSVMGIVETGHFIADFIRRRFARSGQAYVSREK